MRKWDGTTAIHWGKHNMLCVVRDERFGVEHKNCVHSIAVGTGTQQCLKPFLRDPKKHLVIEDSVPLGGCQAVPKASTKVAVAHRNLVPDNGLTILRVIDRNR